MIALVVFVVFVVAVPTATWLVLLSVAQWRDRRRARPARPAGRRGVWHPSCRCLPAEFVRPPMEVPPEWVDDSVVIVPPEWSRSQ